MTDEKIKLEIEGTTLDFIAVDKFGNIAPGIFTIKGPNLVFHPDRDCELVKVQCVRPGSEFAVDLTRHQDADGVIRKRPAKQTVGTTLVLTDIVKTRKPKRTEG